MKKIISSGLITGIILLVFAYVASWLLYEFLQALIAGIIFSKMHA